MRRAILSAVGVAMAFAALGCDRPSPSTTEAAPPTSAPAVASTVRPLGVPDVMQRAHEAFHRSAKGFDAYGAAHVATVADDGSLRFSAYAGETLRLETTSSGSSASARGRAERDAAGSVHIARDTSDERFTNGRDGVEQSWTFDRRPPSASVDLTVSASGLSYLGRSERGLLFGGARSRVRYGAATFVDARGTETAIPVAWNGRAITMHLDRELLGRAQYPARLDPLIGPEAPIDTAPVYGKTVLDQEDPAMGASSSTFYAAWLDQRRVVLDLSVEAADLYGARVDPVKGIATGDDASGVLLFRDVVLSEATQPIVASAAGDFLVLEKTNALYQVVRVDGTTGHPLASDVGGLVIAQMDAGPAVIGSSGDTYVVVWGTGSSIQTQRIGRQGAPLDPVPVTLVQTTDATSTAISCGPTVCVIAWTDDGDGISRLIRFDPATGHAVANDATSPLSLAATIAPPNNRISAVTYANGTFLVAWGSVIPGDGSLYGARFDASLGGFLPGDGATGKKLLATNERPIAMTFDGTRYVGEWAIASGAQLQVETWDGTTLAEGGAAPVTSLSNVSPEAVPQIGSVNGVSYIIALDGGGRVRGVLFDNALRKDKGASFVTVSQANIEAAPSIASNATGTTNATGAEVVWMDGRVSAGEFGIYGARLDANGTVLPADATGQVISTSSTSYQAQPALVSDGTDYIAAWTTYNLFAFGTSINAARISSATGLPVAQITPIANSGAQAPAIACDGTHVAIGYVNGTTVGVSFFDAKTLASFAPALSLQGGAVASDAVEFSNPQIAFSGGSYLMVWTVGSIIDASTTKIGYLRFGADGHLIEGPSAVPSATGGQFAPALAPFASGTGGYLLVWQDLRDDPRLLSMFGRFVPASGEIEMGPELRIGRRTSGSVEFQSDMTPGVVDARDGLNFQTTWSDGLDLYSALVGYDGTVRDATPVTVADQPAAYGHPRLASMAPGTVAMAYDRIDPSGTLGSFRVYTRTLGTGQMTGSCTTDGQCASRLCKDGFCCATACDGACETCAATPGTCTSIHQGNDPDSCTGESVCTESGACLALAGTACAHGSQCASGFCVDGVCCGSACDGGCDVCNADGALGVCTVSRAGSTGGSPTCIPYICDGTSHICPSECSADDQCVRPYLCAPSGKCELPTSSYCLDSETLKSTEGSTSSCAPYRCVGNACALSCKSIADCAPGLVCDDGGSCVDPTAVNGPSGCAIGPHHDGRDGESSNGANDAAALALLVVAASVLQRKKSVRRPES